MNKEQLVFQIGSIVATVNLIVEDYGMNVKIPIEGETETEIKEAKEMFDQHFKFLGSVGLVNEYTINNNSVNVTVSPQIIGFYTAFVNEIEMISEDTGKEEEQDEIIKAFNKMFPQDKEHCSNCCPYLEEDEDE
jgi:hypothetical protein